MKVIIIEDESIAIRKLEKILKEINPIIEIVAELESVFDAKKWFQSHTFSNVDIIISDIHLSDGLSFEIFEGQQCDLPIIFTTAFDKYAIRAFKLNGIDYLLKPIQKDELKKAIEKFELTKKMYSQNQLVDIQSIINKFKLTQVIYPTFISYQKDKLIPVSSEEIAYFYINNLMVYAVVDKTHYVMNETLDDLERRLPLSVFFRANRQYILHRKFVENAEIYFNNRLKVKLIVKTPEEIIISREKTTLFKIWLTGD